MGTLSAVQKNLKTAIGGSGIAGIGVVQNNAVTTAGVAFNLTQWAGREVHIRVSAEVPFRWALANSPTTVDQTTAASSAASPVATGADWLYPGMPNFRDVPVINDVASGEGVFLIVQPSAGTVAVYISAVS